VAITQIRSSLSTHLFRRERKLKSHAVFAGLVAGHPGRSTNDKVVLRVSILLDPTLKTSPTKEIDEPDLPRADCTAF
jgi:hypothetical protein